MVATPTMNAAQARAYLEAIPFRQARHYHEGRYQPVRFIVEHSTEGSERIDSAEIALAMWATWDRQSSVNFAVDVDSTVCAVKVADTAWHAGGGNSDTVGIEHCGTARQTRPEWLDPYGLGMFEQSAMLNAALIVALDVPFRRASALDHARANGYQPGEPWEGGLLGHVDITESARLRGISTSGHYDPGPAYPWDHLFDRIRAHLEEPVTDAEMRKIAEYIAVRLRADDFMGNVDPGPQTVKAACADAIRENIKDEYLRVKP
jgi:hypothetical protein